MSVDPRGSTVSVRYRDGAFAAMTAQWRMPDAASFLAFHGAPPALLRRAARDLALSLGRRIEFLRRRGDSWVVFEPNNEGYIGETEKNLSIVMARAAARGIALFFDEADALFGRGTATVDAHDRYANLEVSHLLSRHRGLVIGAFASAVEAARTRPGVRQVVVGFRG